MTSSAIDYFATLGRKNGSFVPKTSSGLIDESRKQLTPSELWLSAITDISLVDEEAIESLDPSWTVIKFSAEGEPLVEPFVAFRRRKDTHRQDHVTKVRLIDYL
jgi:hypothetical protein